MINRFKIAATCLRIVAPIFARAQTHHREALDERHIDGDGRDAATCEADDKQTPVKGNAANTLIKNITAHGIKDHIGTAPIGELFHLLAKTRCDIDDVISPALFHGFEFFIRGRGRNDFRTEQAPDINRRQTNTARTAMHEQCLARL